MQVDKHEKIPDFCKTHREHIFSVTSIILQLFQAETLSWTSLHSKIYGCEWTVFIKKEDTASSM